jgi:poly(hydroxyalkanoate) depolymerase family esterase
MPNFAGSFPGFAGKPTPSQDRLSDLEAFGDNPGNLRARIYRPPGFAGRLPLVVVLHGCTQTAAGYDAGAGWSALADEAGFLLLYPEQKRANNPNLCFNWFTPGDIRRDAGEALSIRQVIETLVRDQAVDPARIFVTGLSAGGAMTSVMLATYPEVFAGGAIIAGLPYATASGVPQALERMNGAGIPNATELEMRVRQASTHQGPWPAISVWHGTKDATVNLANAEAILSQWRAVHKVAAAPTESETVDGIPHRIWRDARGNTVIEDYLIPNMGHGTPLDPKVANGGGTAGPFMLDVGIASTRHIAASWGIASVRSRVRPEAAPAAEDASDAQERVPTMMPVLRSVRPHRIPGPRPVRDTPANGVQQIIEKALRAAGLMR